MKKEVNKIISKNLNFRSNKFIIFTILLILLLIILNLDFFRNIDYFISNNISILWGPTLNHFFIVITSIANLKILFILTLILLGILLIKRKYNKALFAGSLIILSSIFGELIKISIKRPRPTPSLIAVSDYSFPSLHALQSIIFFLLVIYLFKDEIKNKFIRASFIILNILLFTLIGFSRIYLNVHWLSDVLAGFALGLYISYVSLFVRFKTS
jgi:undecaprenyl-diphosphatase